MILIVGGYNLIISLRVVLQNGIQNYHYISTKFYLNISFETIQTLATKRIIK